MNADAIRIWNLVQDQRIYVGMEGVSVALKHEPIWKLIDELGIANNRIKTFEKVLKVFQHVRILEKG